MGSYVMRMKTRISRTSAQTGKRVGGISASLPATMAPKKKEVETSALDRSSLVAGRVLNRRAKNHYKGVSLSISGPLSVGVTYWADRRCRE